MSSDFVFQVDSDLVNSVYSEHDNYLIEGSSENENSDQKYCALYFSSNNLYFPNNEEVFIKTIIEKNRFEWYGSRILKASKHIFLRDVHKQWYLTGINSQINDPNKFLDFLKKETAGYRVITVGSSSGGFAAVLYGQLLNAERIYTFNGQYELDSLLKKSSQEVDPIIFRNKENQDLRSFYDIKKFIKDPSRILYFRSNKSDWDVEQHDHIKEIGVRTFSFNTDHHGIPFAKTALPKVLNMNVDDLCKYTKKKLNPILFSLRIAGFKLTYIAALSAIQKKLKR